MAPEAVGDQPHGLRRLADALGLRQVGQESGDDSREPFPLYRVRVTISVIGGEWGLYVIGREYDHPQLFRVITEPTSSRTAASRSMVPEAGAGSA